MKCLVFILAIGLLLPSFGRTNRVIKMCGLALIRKIDTVCGTASVIGKALRHPPYGPCNSSFSDHIAKTGARCNAWEKKASDRIRRRLCDPPGPFQTSDDNENAKDMNMKKVQKMYDGIGRLDIETSYGKQLSYNDYTQYEQMSDDFNEYVSETEKDSVMQPSFPKNVNGAILTPEEIALISKCCNSGCNIDDLSIFC